MAYKRLGRQLQNYEQSVPEWLQGFFDEYSADPFQGAVIDELTRRSGENLDRNLGQVASYFGGMGRSRGGLMGQSLGEITNEEQQRLRGDIGGLMSGDYQAHMQRMMDAANAMSGIQQTGMGGMAQGYSADQSKQATLGAARMAADASRYNTDAYRAIGMGNLGMNKDFGTWDRTYRSEMMPYEQLNMLGSGAGGLLSGFGQNRQWGQQSGTPSTGGKGGNMAQGALGGGLMGWGMNRRGGGGGWGNYPMGPGGGRM